MYNQSINCNDNLTFLPNSAKLTHSHSQTISHQIFSNIMSILYFNKMFSSLLPFNTSVKSNSYYRFTMNFSHEYIQSVTCTSFFRSLLFTKFLWTYKLSLKCECGLQSMQQKKKPKWLSWREKKYKTNGV